MSFVYRHDTSVERQVFLLACVWDAKGLVDGPSRAQVAQFVGRAEMDGQWTPVSLPGGGGREVDDENIIDLLFSSLQQRSYIDSVRHMSRLDRDGNGVERQAFLLACVWDDLGMADGPTLSQVERFMILAEASGQWTPEVTGFESPPMEDESSDIMDLLHVSLQTKRARSVSSTVRCKAPDENEHGPRGTRCLHSVVGEARAPLGIHFCAHHMQMWTTPDM
jgi:hypothetical protein